MRVNSVGRLCLLGVFVATFAVSGCGLLPDAASSGTADQAISRGFISQPRIRYGTYPCAIIGTPLCGPKLGTHAYYWSPFEKDGIAYTCHAGQIDIIHLRIAADWTAYLTAQSYKHLMKGDTRFVYKLAVDRSRDFVQISYPKGWACLPEETRRTIAREIALAMGPYLTYTTVTWHEILTWYGFKCIGLPVEFASAFSWEDSYSNLLGTIIAVRALRDTRHSYNKAVEIAINDEMCKLGIQPAHAVKEASESVRGKWFTGNLAILVDMKKRNFDIGLDDGFVTPTVTPEMARCPEAQPVSYPVPDLSVLDEYGFSVTMEIEPHEWEKNKILRIVHQKKRINPQLHFAQIMDDVRRQAAARYGPEYSPDHDTENPPIYTAK
jgi:hypothetical protein